MMSPASSATPSATGSSRRRTDPSSASSAGPIARRFAKLAAIRFTLRSMACQVTAAENPRHVPRKPHRPGYFLCGRKDIGEPRRIDLIGTAHLGRLNSFQPISKGFPL